MQGWLKNIKKIVICMCCVIFMILCAIVYNNNYNGLIGSSYYTNGEKQTGWIEIDGESYFFDYYGIMQKNRLFKDYNGDLYYADENGHIIYNTEKNIYGEKYIFDERGIGKRVPGNRTLKIFNNFTIRENDRTEIIDKDNIIYTSVHGEKIKIKNIKKHGYELTIDIELIYGDQFDTWLHAYVRDDFRSITILDFEPLKKINKNEVRLITRSTQIDDDRNYFIEFF